MESNNKSNTELYDLTASIQIELVKYLKKNKLDAASNNFKDNNPLFIKIFEALLEDDLATNKQLVDKINESINQSINK